MKFNLKLILLSKMLFLLNLSMLVSTGFVLLKERSEPKGRKLNELNAGEVITNPMLDWKVNYEKTIEHLKKHEGFAGGKVYTCPGGHKTIGYGHVILEGESFEELTQIQADSLLRVDFNKALREVDKTVKIAGIRKLAIAHFVYTKGIGTFINSGLRDKVATGQTIDEELMRFCYYKNSEGKSVRSQHAYKIRKWELDFYNLKS